MPLPKKIKKYIPLTESKTLLPRRQELVDKINKDGTYFSNHSKLGSICGDLGFSEY